MQAQGAAAFGAGAGAGGAGAPDAGFQQVLVTDPKKQSDGLTSFISYRVTRTTGGAPGAGGGGGGGGEVEPGDVGTGGGGVIRRFNDFVWLRSALVDAFPGCIVAPLPEKVVVGRFSEEFVETRRRALEKFLNRVLNHGVLRDSPAFEAFLTADDAGLQRAKDEAKEQLKAQQAAQGGGSSGGLMNWLDNTMAQMSVGHDAGGGAGGAGAAAGGEDGGGAGGTGAGAAGEAAGGFGGAGAEAVGSEQERTPLDTKFDELHDYVINLETHMAEVARHAAELVKRHRERGQAMFQFGLGFTMLGQAEVGTLADALQAVGQISDEIQSIMAEQAENETVHFAEPLEEYCRIIAAVKAAVVRRNEKKLAYRAAVSDLETKQAILTKAHASGKPEKVTSAEAAKNRAEEIVHATKTTYEEVSASLVDEIERFKREKATDMKRIMHEYIALQVDCHRRLEEKWQSVLPVIERIVIDPATDATGVGGTGAMGGEDGGAHDAGRGPGDAVGEGYGGAGGGGRAGGLSEPNSGMVNDDDLVGV